MLSMKQMYRTLAILGVILGLAAAPALAGGPRDFADLSEAWEKAYNAGDAAGVAALYAEDGIMMPPNTPAAQGRAAIQASLEENEAVTPGRLEIETVEHGHSGTLGYARGTYAVVDGEGNTLDRGKWIDVRKKIDGKWFIAADIWNSDMPLAGE